MRSTLACSMRDPQRLRLSVALLVAGVALTFVPLAWPDAPVAPVFGAAFALAIAGAALAFRARRVANSR